MTVDVWKGTLKCTVSRASHDETCSLGRNGNWSDIGSFYIAKCYCTSYTYSRIGACRIIITQWLK